MEQTQNTFQRSPDLIDLMPLYAKRVIDIGCGPGNNAKEFHSRANPEYYLGVEIVPEDAEQARQYCSECIVGNIEEFDEQQWGTLANYDLWVFGDVLEHLYDPWRLLQKVRTSITAGGEIICCIPNVQHWSLQCRLSIGDWRYDEKGLLDRTHIRFFTRQTIIEMLHGAGFDITEIVPRYVNHPSADKFLDIIEKMAAAAGGDSKIARAEAAVFQYIVRGR
jgi:trans-aconitate methyltransferase